MRRPGRVAQARGFVSCRELQQALERTWRSGYIRVRIADFYETFWNREHRKICWLAVRDLAPVKRGGDTSIGERAHGICRARGSVLGVLVVVEEHAVPLLFPPFRGGEG